MMQTNSTIQNIIAVLNSHNPNILSIQKFMLLARVQRAAKLGDTDAQRYVALCELNAATCTKH
jgi:hypothetical protein